MQLLVFELQLNLTELRTFPNPPAIVANVSAAVLVLLSPQGRIPKDRSWKASKVVMSKVGRHPLRRFLCVTPETAHLLKINHLTKCS